MWVCLGALVLMGSVVLLSCLASLQHYYFALLESIFGYANAQLQQNRLQLERQEREAARVHSTILPEVPPQNLYAVKDKLNVHMEQCCDVLSAGLCVVLEDEVTPRFAAAHQSGDAWNLLTRTLSHKRRFLNKRLRLLWICGLLLRYSLLLPLRVVSCAAALIIMTFCTAVLGQLPSSECKRRLVKLVLRQCFRLMACSISIVSRFHNTQYRPSMGICVCNHTSPLDVLVLMCDVNYSLTGQRHGGILGLVQRALTRVSPHMWFERRALVEREALGIVLRLHVARRGTPPILLFPEGTCINNTAVMQFKKGSFAVSNIIYPMAVRYDRRFGETFWDSSRYSMLRYMLMVISSWSILCDIWYMPALLRRPRETPIEFASRVKAEIAAQAGIEDLPWDGNLKRWSPKRDWQ
ncbi:glycerol-3-phosphate acyltransferase 3 [Scaptodrosophila lebanonensis]|uniref:Glycerol-3-phosphate acyltransferase 3 n=1 Tax=Drosophila lebanonensis TaxID=7225 RepID=A0A6J2TTY0_DROLE|nr:glycerol-3-phosphate acyltransferase 3 [Scaptodrosophila lebanonensis]